jgi:predicted helicase
LTAVVVWRESPKVLRIAIAIALVLYSARLIHLSLEYVTDYRVVIVGVTDPQVQELIERRELVSVAGLVETDSRTLAAHIGLAKAVKDYDLKKTISFHGRIKTAQAFAQDFPKIVEWMPDDHKPSGTFWADTINGAMNSSERRILLEKLKADTPNQHSLLSNARCLTEGIDVPALDAVAFADPRKSQVDIVQAVGRAMRKPMGKSKKTTGYIILPVYLTKKELKDPETAVEGSAFEPVLQVLRALKDHDPFMATFMAKILVAKGKKPHQKLGGIREILEVSIGDELDKVLARRLLEAVQLRAIEVSADSFEFIQSPNFLQTFDSYFA